MLLSNTSGEAKTECVMKVDLKKLVASEAFTGMLAKALQPLAELDETDVQIGITVRTAFNTSMCVKVSDDFDLLNFDVEVAAEGDAEAEEGECCNTSCDCTHKGDGL